MQVLHKELAIHMVLALLPSFLLLNYIKRLKTYFLNIPPPLQGITVVATRKLLDHDGAGKGLGTILNK